MLGFSLLILSTSCVHDRAAMRVATIPAASALIADIPSEAPVASLASAGDALALAPLTAEQALSANADLPLAGLPNPAAAAFFARGRTPLDQLRSLDCLAQAIYYEARSETEAGQRAVAQVVLNRVRHPSYPASVCGVVYQGPMRAGGGCQFSFTCDGSLATRPSGFGWLRARDLAAEALAGRVYAPVGLATHYHTSAVFPHWAPQLIKSALIGAHIFYRLPGTPGAPGAFRQPYAGREPFPIPAKTMIRTPNAQLAALALPQSPGALDTHLASLVTAPPDNLPKVKLTERGLPQSTIREAYRNTGRPRLPNPAGPSDVPAH